jgi:hypothetical protein
MIDYSIPEDELERLYLSTHLDREGITILWKQFINYTNVVRKKSFTLRKKPKATFEHFVIYNALRGKPLFNGIDGKREMEYFRARLEGNTVQSHPYMNHYYNLARMEVKMERMLNTTASAFESPNTISGVKALNNVLGNWLNWLDYSFGGLGPGNRKHIHVHNRDKRMYVRLLHKHIKIYREMIMEQLKAENHIVHNYYIP